MYELFGIAVAVLTAGMLWRIRNADAWRATVTPLASIIGSGFLVVAPLLAHVAGPAAAFAMLAILALSFWIGSAIRSNILAEDGERVDASPLTERLSDLSLTLAYVISIAFYIRLLAAFVLDGLDLHTPLVGDLLATAILAFIGLHGYLRDLRGLERLEEYSVAIKLAVIAAMLTLLAHFDAVNGYDLTAVEADDSSNWEKLRVLAGMLLIVQGFETSKFLGSTYSAELRARTMKYAQLIAALVYIAFIVLILPLTGYLSEHEVSETALIGLVDRVSPMLPLLIVIAAAMSQFSAAIADALGAGGVVYRESRHRLPERLAYPVIAAAAVLLIWLADIFELISLASRAFALFYFLQAVQAARIGWHGASGSRRARIVANRGALALMMLLIALFGKAIEG